MDIKLYKDGGRLDNYVKSQGLMDNKTVDENSRASMSGWAVNGRQVVPVSLVIWNLNSGNWR